MKEIIEKVKRFRDRRDWEQFHNPKDLAISISIECGELLEHFQWKNNEKVKEYIRDIKKKEKIGKEIADIFIYLLLLSDSLDLDLYNLALKKITENEKKYPVEKAKGTAKKYTDL